MTNAELTAYYENLLILQYKGMPKAEATIRAYLNMLNIFELIDAVDEGYNIDTAVGIQLDVLGKYIGVSRIVTGISFTRSYFGFMGYGEDPATAIFSGFMGYGDTILDEQFLGYGDSQKSILILLDEEYRILLKFKILINHSNCSLKDIDDFLFTQYGNDVYVTDNLDRTLTYTFPNVNARLATILYYQNCLPKSAGTQILLAYTTGT